MVLKLVSGSNFQALAGSVTQLGHSFVFLGKPLYLPMPLLRLDFRCIGTAKLNAGSQPCGGLTSHPGWNRNASSRFVLVVTLSLNRRRA